MEEIPFPTLSCDAKYSKYNPVHSLHFPDVASGLERALQKERKEAGGGERQFVPATGKIQRQWCYRAPIKKLSLHRQWHAFQPLLTAPLFQSVSLTAHSVSVCLAPDEASSDRAI